MAGRFALIAAPAIPIAAMNLPMQVFLPPYYATRTGLSLAAIGFAFMIVRLGDICVDPLLGIAIDRTKSAFGRFRPWILLGAPVVMIGTWLAFFPPVGASVIYLIAALIFILAGHSLVIVTQYAWAASLANNGGERASVYGWIQAASVLGMLLTLSMMPLVRTYLKDTPDLAVHAWGLFILVTMPLTVLLVATMVPEPARSGLKHLPSISKSLIDYGILLCRPPVLRVIGCTLFTAMASGVTGALYVFFTAAKGITSSQASLLLLVYFLAAFLASRLWTSVSSRFGKHIVLAAVCAYACLIQSAAVFLPQGAVGWAGIGQFALGISYSGTLVLQRAIVGDVAAEMQHELDEDVTGHLYALYTSVTKMSVAISAALVFFALQAIGFAPKAGGGNTPSTIREMELAFILIPAFLAAAAGLAIYKPGAPASASVTRGSPAQ